MPTERFAVDLAHFFEVPEYISVETRLITQQASGAVQVTTVSQQSPPIGHEEAITILDDAPTKKSMQDASTETDSPFPHRERAQQTDEMNTADAAIQFNGEEDLPLWEDNEPVQKEEEESKTDIKDLFLDFVKEKTKVYKNNKTECLICGEIAATAKQVRLHMALHWGTERVCFECGVLKRNDELHLQEGCLAHQKNPKRPKKIKCPHYDCPVEAISKQELYDHINEHCNVKPYHCQGCKRDFHTAGEYRHHLPLRLKCLTKARRQQLPYERWPNKSDYIYRARVFGVYSNRKRCILVKSFLSQRINGARRRICTICLKYSSNSFQHAMHTKRCKRIYMQRINKKRGQSLPTLTNGHGKVTEFGSNDDVEMID